MLPRLALVVAVVFLGRVYQAIQPPPPNICGSPNGPPVTSARIRLKDGRHLAYKETGVPREKAKYKVIVNHGFRGSKDFIIPASPELIEELGVCFVTFDRAGYGESDPNPKRSVKSQAVDIEQLADQLGFGSKFYVVGVSMGGHSAWASLKYIPHRLAGVGLIVPVINYWWPSFPANLSADAYGRQPVSDQWALRVAHHAPSLFYWWMTQKWFPALSVANGNPELLSKQDKAILHQISIRGLGGEDRARQQGDFESLHRDAMVGFGTWEFDPMELKNPFPNKEGSVHLWQGYEDRLVPFDLQRYISKKLPWIKYHEIPDGGHMLMFVNGFGDTFLRQLLLGEEAPNSSH